MYKLLQNPTLRLCRLDINKVGLEKAIRIIPGVGTHMRCSQYGASKFEADDIKCYVHVADIEATDMCDPEGWTEIGNSRDFIFFPGTHTW